MNSLFVTLKDEILKRDNFLIASHYSPDGDNIGSCIALSNLLRSLGKKAVIINEDKIPEKLEFLNNVDYITLDEYSGEKFSNVIILDAGDIKRIGRVSNLIEDDAYIINIDHHGSNNGFGDIAIVDIDSASCSMIIYDFIKETYLKMSKEIADAVYAGVISDTGGFRYANTDAKVLRTASELTAFGIDPSYLMEMIFFKSKFSEIKKVGEIISKTKLLAPGVAYLYHDQLNDPLNDNDPVIDQLNSIDEANVTFFARKVKDNLIKVSLRTKTDFNVSDFASIYDGGGHPKAAGMRFKGTKEEMEKKVLNNLIEKLG